MTTLTITTTDGSNRTRQLTISAERVNGIVSAAVRNDQGRNYTIRISESSETCECKGNREHGKRCYHISNVARIFSRERATVVTPDGKRVSRVVRGQTSHNNQIFGVVVIGKREHDVRLNCLGEWEVVDASEVIAAIAEEIRREQAAARMAQLYREQQSAKIIDLAQKRDMMSAPLNGKGNRKVAQVSASAGDIERGLAACGFMR